MNKLGYLRKRYEKIYKEGLKRGYNLTYYGGAWDGIDQSMMGDWKPDQRARRLIFECIKKRLEAMR